MLGGFCSGCGGAKTILIFSLGSGWQGPWCCILVFLVVGCVFGVEVVVGFLESPQLVSEVLNKNQPYIGFGIK